MKKFSMRWLGKIIFIVSFSAILSAQEKKEAAPQRDAAVPDQEKKADAPLPKIDLPEFVITGQESIILPEYSKKEIDEEKIFSPSKPEAGNRNISVGSAFVPKQTKSFVQQPQPLNGKIFAGMGFFTTPILDGWFGQHDNQNSYVLNGYYHRSSGHVDFGEWWKGGFGAKGNYVMPESSLIPFSQLNGKIFYDRENYKAYASASPSRVRSVSFAEIAAGIGSRYALPYRSLSGFDYSGTIGWNAHTAVDSISVAERDGYFSANASTKFEDLFMRGQIDYRTTAYDMPISSQSGQWFVLKFDGRTMLLKELQLNFSVQQYLFRGNIGKASGRLFPQAELRYFMTENAAIYTAFNPSVERNTLSSIIRLNKYIDFNAPIVPTENPIGVVTGMEVRLTEQITTNAKYHYRHINNYLTFLDSNDAKVWEVFYLSGVRSSKFDVNLSYRPDEKTIVRSYCSFVQEKIKDSTNILPYVPKFSSGIVYYHAFDFGVNVEATTEYFSSRYSKFFSKSKNAGYVLAGVKADMTIFSTFRAYAEIGNLFNQKFYIWNGYRERPLFLLFGISYSW